LRFTLRRIVTNFRLQAEFEDLDRDVARVEARLLSCFGRDKLEPNHQIQVLANLFFRNKAAYIIGKVINGNRDYPFVIPVMHRQKGSLVLDTVLTEAMQITAVFIYTCLLHGGYGSAMRMCSSSAAFCRRNRAVKSIR
jgi:isocitrate dehydrogenase kinase/phosphatase